MLVEAEGFQPLNISGTEVLAGAQAIQPAKLTGDEDSTPPEDPIVIPDHTLFGNYPPKIAEAEVKPIGESGEIVLSRVVVPQTVVVHDGTPTDSTAKDYYVPYRIILKMWPPVNLLYLAQNTITANVLAISPLPKRVYTEWYGIRAMISRSPLPLLLTINGSTAEIFLKAFPRL